MENTGRSFGTLLRQLRLDAGLTQEALAERASLGTRSISALERAENRPHRETVRRLARALGLSEASRARLEGAGAALPRRRTTSRPPPDSPRPAGRRPGPAGGVARLSGAIPNNLSVHWTSFVGREQELREVRQWLAGTAATPTGETHLLTLTGVGGCGKTRLALRAAEGLLPEFPDGVWLVDLAAVADPRQVPLAVAAVLGVREPAGHDLATALARFLRSKRLLLLWDNCEHVLAACAHLAQGLLSGAPGLRLLATSRAALGSAGEVTLPVPPLATPPLGAATRDDRLVAYEAIRLFLDRARAVAPSFALTPDNAAAVVQICRQLDGLPLALELAARRLRGLTVRQVADRIDDRFRLLGTGGHAGVVRHQTLRAAVDWSYDLLSPEERRLLRRLAVFRGGWTAEAAAAVSASAKLELPAHPPTGVDPAELADARGEDALDLLSQLVDKSLVTLEEKDGVARYGMLRTIWQYSSERLADASEVPAVGARHAGWCRELAERAEPYLWGNEQRRWLDRLETEHDNLRAALEWCHEHDVTTGLGLAGDLAWFWLRRNYLVEGLRWLEDLIEKAGPGRADLAAPPLARALLGAGYLAVQLTAFTRATPWLTRAEPLLAAHGDAWGLAMVYRLQSHVAIFRCDLERARQLAEGSLALFRQIGADWGTGMALRELGRIANVQRDDARAEALLTESLAILRTVGDQRAVAIALFFLGVCYESRGDLVRARTWAEEAMATSRADGDRWVQGLILSGQIARRQHDYARARAYWEESAALPEELGRPAGMAWTLLHLGELATLEGDVARARSRFREGIALLRALNMAPAIAQRLALVGAPVMPRDAPDRSSRSPGIVSTPRALPEAAIPVHLWGREWDPEPLLRAARDALGEEEYARAWTAVQAMTPEQAIADALQGGIV